MAMLMTRPRFALRTLFIFMTLAAVVVWYVLYRLDKQGWMLIDRNFEADVVDAKAFGQEFVRRMALVPGHALSTSPLFPDSESGFALRTMEGAKDLERYFYKIRLSDGSVTNLGFFVFKTEEHGKPLTRVLTVIVATDSYMDRRAGSDKRRIAERHRLAESYNKMLAELRDDWIAGRPMPP